MKIYCVIVGCGDGSNALRWFKDTPLRILTVLDELTGDYEEWGSGDGVQINTFTFPDDFDFASAGIRFYDEQLKERLNDEN